MDVTASATAPSLITATAIITINTHSICIRRVRLACHRLLRY